MSSVKDFLFEPFRVIEVKFRGSDCPRPRSGHRIACDDGYVYCFGGYNPSLLLNQIERTNPRWSPSRPLFRELWSFNTAKKKWKEHEIIENMPEELASNAMCINGRYLMVCFRIFLVNILYILKKPCNFIYEFLLDIWWYGFSFWQ